MIKAVIFDMDGVLIDIEPIFEEHKREYLKKMGYEIPDGFFDKYRGSSRKGYWEALIGILEIPESIDELIEDSRIDYLKYLESVNIEAIPGTKELIDKILKNGLKIGVASSASKERILKLLSRIGLKNKFESITCGDDVVHGKPAPDIYLKAALSLNVKPEECLAIEDATSGVKSAKAAGMNVVGYAGSLHNTQNLSDADQVIKNFSEINLDKVEY